MKWMFSAQFIMSAQILSAQGNYEWLRVPNLLPRIKVGLSKMRSPENGSRELSVYEAKLASAYRDQAHVELKLLMEAKSELDEAKKVVLNYDMKTFYERVKDFGVRRRWESLRVYALRDYPRHSARAKALWAEGVERYGITNIWSPSHDRSHSFRGEASEIVTYVAPVRDYEEFLRLKSYAEHVRAEWRSMFDIRRYFAEVWAEVQAASRREPR